MNRTLRPVARARSCIRWLAFAIGLVAPLVKPEPAAGVAAAGSYPTHYGIAIAGDRFVADVGKDAPDARWTSRWASARRDVCAALAPRAGVPVDDTTASMRRISPGDRLAAVSWRCQFNRARLASRRSVIHAGA